MAEGSAQDFTRGPEGPAGAMQMRLQYEEALARLDQQTELTDTQRAKICIDDLKAWLSEHGIDSSNLEELLVQDVIESRK